MARWRDDDTAPQVWGGWTECQVAALQRVVLLSSRNFYGRSSGQGRDSSRAQMTAGRHGPRTGRPGGHIDSPARSVLRASVLGDPGRGSPRATRRARYRANFSVHTSYDGGSSWPESVVYAGGAAYSDLTFTRNGSVAVLFEKDNYNSVALAWCPPGRPRTYRMGRRASDFAPL